MPTSEEAAVAAAAGESVEAQETESGTETETTETEEFVFPSFEIELPAELAAELEEEDADDSVTADDIAALSEQYPETEEGVLQELAKARKRTKHLEDLRVKEAKKNWSEEAKKFFPLSEPFLDEIQATSRRGYLRTAKNVHERMAPLVEEKVLKPARESIAKTKTEVEVEAKEEVKKSWGEPVVNDKNEEVPGGAEREQRRQRRGELSDTIRGMIFKPPSD